MTGGGAEDYAEAVLVVARGGAVHHFDGAAGEAETEGPEGGLPGPGYEAVGCCAGGVREEGGSGWVEGLQDVFYRRGLFGGS